MENNNYPGSYYQPLFDLLNQEHGITPLESEMTDIIEVVEKMRGKQPGPRWVKASERLPKHFIAKFVMIEGVMSIAAWHKDHERFVDDAGDFHPADQVEWLDEQPAAGREEDAVEKEKAKAWDDWKDSLIKHDNVLVHYRERPEKYIEPFTFEEFKAVMLEKSPVFIYNTMYSGDKHLYQITSRFMPSGVDYFATSWADKTPKRKTLEQFYNMLKLDGLECIRF